MNQISSNTGETAAVLGVEHKAACDRVTDALFLASNAFLNVEQLFIILRGETEGCGTIDRERVAALVQIGIDLTHTKGELAGKEADAFFEACRAIRAEVSDESPVTETPLIKRPIEEILATARAAGRTAFTTRETLDSVWEEINFAWLAKAMPVAPVGMSDDDFNSLTDKATAAFEEGVEDYLAEVGRHD